MKLKYQFVFYILFLHILIFFFAFDSFQSQKLWFIGIEVLLAGSLYLAFKLYQNFLKPLDLISTGVKSIKDKDFSIKYLKVGNREMDQLIEVFNKMIDQLRDERRIQQERNYFLEKLMSASPIGIIVLDGEEKIKDINPTALELLNISLDDAIGKHVVEIDSPISEKINRLEDDDNITLKHNGIESFKLSKAHFMDRGFHNHFILIEELTNEVLEIEKNAYGKVIRMMSHEVNNSIGAVNSLINSLRSYKGDLKTRDRSDFENALEVVITRNDNMNRFMNNFADVIRLPSPVTEGVEVNKFLRDLQKLMQPFCDNHHVNLILETSKGDYYQEMDVRQMEQLMVNVIKNAVESIGQEGEIRLIIDEKKNELRVEDSGKGLTQEEVERLFTPFFSSKKGGQGIGLTLCREIAINHGFRIILENVEDRGAVFRVLFYTGIKTINTN